jgi:uncharacterized Fe-S cluster protein YjdI
MIFCVGGEGRMFKIKEYSWDHPAVLVLDLPEKVL